MDKTILYYSACTENKDFEQRIRDNILANCGDIPIVSVTQEPVDFGINICVGRHKNMYVNEFIQILIGIREIKTKYTLMAEADFLYPPEYFQFIPQGDMAECYHAYRYHDVYVMFKQSMYYLKVFSDGAQMVETEFFRGLLEDAMGKYWVEGEWQWDAPPVGGHGGYLIRSSSYQAWTGNPAVTFKTGAGVTRYTAVKKHDGKSISAVDLPFWGNAHELRERMFKKGEL